MRVLGIETSCDDTGVAIYCTERGLLGQALHSQVAMHERYGGVVVLPVSAKLALRAKVSAPAKRSAGEGSAGRDSAGRTRPLRECPPG